jgi:DHA2 family multidrug resistance protein
MLPRSVVMMVGMPIAGRIYNQLGPRLMIASGLALSAVASLQMALFTDQTSYLGLMIPQLWQGLAFSLIFVSLSTAALARVPRPKMTNASALYNLVRQVGGSFGIAIFVTMLERRQTIVASRLVGHIDPFNMGFVTRYQGLAAGLAARGFSADEAGRKALALLNGMVQKQAAVMAFEHAFFVIGALFVITLPLIFLLRPRGEAIPTAHVE